MKTAAYSSLFLALACFGIAAGQGAKDRTERKTVTVVSGTGADGSSEISREAVKECIVSLPSVAALEADVKSESDYLREINGDPARNEWVKTYTASISINYMVYRKDLLIVTTKSIEGKDPVLKEVEKRLPKSREFVSNPANGDLYAGKSNRQYYFTKAEDAVKDAKSRAAVWLKQQAPLQCTEK